jgi:flagellar hook assembly protein FlgD
LFIFYLSADSDIQIKIYTEQGRLIWKHDYARDEPQGKKGAHEGDIVWDGRDEQGDKVISGVYDAYILTNNGCNYASTKISVVR